MAQKRRESLRDVQKALDTLRQRIDRTDAQILSLLNRRARLAQRIGDRKKDKGSIYVPGRERAIFDRLLELNDGPLPDHSVSTIYREIISASRALEAPLRVSYLGPEASYAHMAAREQFGSNAEFIPVETIPNVFSSVENAHADYGVVPVENSSQGSVAVTLDVFVDTNLCIVSERAIEIRHCLLSKARKRERIERVTAHPQSLAQCRRWIQNNLPGVSVTAASSNSRAAELARRDIGMAAIAGRLAAQKYRLNVIDEDIQDEAANYTRFAVLGREPAPPSRRGDHKTSVILSVRDQAGVLFDVLKPFADNHINLLRIESRPLRGRPWEYVFFIDIEGRANDTAIAEALEEIAPLCMTVKVLGSYTSFLPRSMSNKSERQK